MAAAQTRPSVHVRGEGGALIGFYLPLPPGIEDRLLSGSLVRVNPDGSRWTGDADEDPAPLVGDTLAAQRAAQERERATQNNELRETAVEQPAKSAKKAEWVDYAVSTGTITEAAAKELTHAELVARFGDDADPADDEDGVA